MNELEWNRSLPDMLERAAQIAASVPDKVTARAHLYRTVVVIDVEGPRLGAFALVLAEEAPEIVYDDQYVRFQTVPEGVDELLVFAQESIEKIVEFLLSERSPVERTSRILRRTYVSIPLDDGTSWRLKHHRRRMRPPAAFPEGGATTFWRRMAGARIYSPSDGTRTGAGRPPPDCGQKSRRWAGLR
ncbi:hypothetical protein ACQ3I4_09845 [Zafaria sp. Z1313]|uniref:hypothetical protein n=1 Tax=Zafaria sp. Z1313 TaxID=3423202 RepID=UPI003D30252F